MSNLDKDTKNILIGSVVGGIIGICAASLFLCHRKEGKTPHLSSLGKVVAQMGEMLSSYDISPTSVIKDIDKKVHEHEDTISDVLTLISSGIHLWNKLKG